LVERTIAPRRAAAPVPVSLKSHLFIVETLQDFIHNPHAGHVLAGTLPVAAPKAAAF
jgi:hypothetical protein